MRTLGQVVDAIIQDSRRGDPDEIAKIVQRHYYSLCTMTDWQSMRNKQSITFASSAAGKILPSDLIGIMAVFSSEGVPYQPAPRNEFMNTGGCRSWFYVSSPTTPLDTVVPDGNPASGITVGENENTFSGKALGGDRTGEYIRFSQEPGVYKLTSANTFTPYYRGDLLDNVPAIVRPATTRFLNISDAEGNLSSDTVTVYYWSYPEPLYQEWQEIMLPATRALELMCIVDLVGGGERKRGQADQFRMELSQPSTGEGAMADMLALNPKFISPLTPRFRNGQTIMFGRRR